MEHKQEIFSKSFSIDNLARNRQGSVPKTKPAAAVTKMPKVKHHGNPLKGKGPFIRITGKNLDVGTPAPGQKREKSFGIVLDPKRIMPLIDDALTPRKGTAKYDA